MHYLYICIFFIKKTLPISKERYNTYAQSFNLILSTAPTTNGQFSENYFIRNIISYRAIHILNVKDGF